MSKMRSKACFRNIGLPDLRKQTKDFRRSVIGNVGGKACDKDTGRGAQNRTGKAQSL